MGRLVRWSERKRKQEDEKVLNLKKEKLFLPARLFFSSLLVSTLSVVQMNETPKANVFPEVSQDYFLLIYDDLFEDIHV